MGRKKLLHGFAGVVARSVLDDKDMFRGLCQDVEQKRRIAFRVEPPCLGFVEEASRKIVDEAKDLVGFAYATRRDFGLVALGSPRVAHSKSTPYGHNICKISM